MNNRRQPIDGKRLWSLNALNKYFAKRFKLDKFNWFSDTTIISLWDKGHRIRVQPVTVWRKMQIEVADEKRLTYIKTDSLIPMTRYQIDITELDAQEIKRGQKR